MYTEKWRTENRGSCWAPAPLNKAPNAGTYTKGKHPLTHLDQLKDAPIRLALAGDALYAYKDGVPVQAPAGKGVYLAATRHHISGSPETAVNADTVLCKLNETTGRYQVIAIPVPLRVFAPEPKIREFLLSGRWQLP
jgi:hypothetical protein